MDLMLTTEANGVEPIFGKMSVANQKLTEHRFVTWLRLYGSVSPK